MSALGILGSVENSDHIAKATGYPNLAGSRPTGKLADALAAAQKEFTTVNKSKTAKGDKFSYKYADLNDVLEMAVPILAKHGIAFMQPLRRDGDKLYVVTRIQLGEEILEDAGLPLPSQVRPQEFGTYLTYYRRYGASTFLAIATDEDTDAVETRPDFKPSTSEQPKPKNSVGRTATGKPVEPSPEPPPAPQTFVASDDDVPAVIGDKPTPQELKEFRNRLKKHIEACGGPDGIKAYVSKITGSENSSNLTTRQWNEVLNPLDEAAKDGKLKELVA